VRTLKTSLLCCIVVAFSVCGPHAGARPHAPRPRAELPRARGPAARACRSGREPGPCACRRVPSPLHAARGPRRFLPSSRLGRGSRRSSAPCGQKPPPRRGPGRRARRRPAGARGSTGGGGAAPASPRAGAGRRARRVAAGRRRPPRWPHRRAGPSRGRGQDALQDARATTPEAGRGRFYQALRGGRPSARRRPSRSARRRVAVNTSSVIRFRKGASARSTSALTWTTRVSPARSGRR